MSIFWKLIKETPWKIRTWNGWKNAADAIVRAKPWKVPWTAETILRVMLLWIVSFWFVGSWIVPFLAHIAGFRKESLTYRGQALSCLLTDVAEGLAGIVILNRHGLQRRAIDRRQGPGGDDPVWIVVSVCAPIGEEIFFRGFLRPSLAKYILVWCAILSVAFALVHFNMQQMLLLVFLGVVMGTLFARSRNLLASMILHSLWNAFVSRKVNV